MLPTRSIRERAQRILAVLNFSDHQRNLVMPSLRAGTLQLGTSLDRPAEAIADKLVLPRNEGVIIELA